MKYAILALLSVALFLGSFAIMYRLGIEKAETLPINSTICLSPDLLAEAERAAANQDDAWIDSLRSCSTTGRLMKIRVLDCEWLTCRVRFWTTDEISYVGYVRAGTLSH